MSIQSNNAIISYIQPLSSEEFIQEQVEKKQHGLQFPVDSYLPFEEPGNPQLTAFIHEKFSSQLFKFYSYCKRESIPFNDPTMIGYLDHKLNLKEKEVCACTLEKGKSVLYKIEKLKVTQLHTITIPADFGYERWTFSLEIDGEKQMQSFDLKSKKMIGIQYLPTAYLNGIDYEICHHNVIQLSTAPPENWDGWKDRLKQTHVTYQQEIYPLVIQMFARVCTSLDHRKLSVLDVGGADAELSIHLIKNCQHIERIRLIDGSPQQVDVALWRKTLNCIFPNDSEREKLDIAPPTDITKMDIEEMTGWKRVDVINLCGIVANGILNRKASEELLIKCKNVLKKDGFILISSYSSPHFSTKNYEKMGYQVLNKTASYFVKNEAIPIKHTSFYVLRRKSY